MHCQEILTIWELKAVAQLFSKLIIVFSTHDRKLKTSMRKILCFKKIFDGFRNSVIVTAIM